MLLGETYFNVNSAPVYAAHYTKRKQTQQHHAPSYTYIYRQAHASIHIIYADETHIINPYNILSIIYARILIFRYTCAYISYNRFYIYSGNGVHIIRECVRVWPGWGWVGKALLQQMLSQYHAERDSYEPYRIYTIHIM